MKAASPHDVAGRDASAGAVSQVGMFNTSFLFASLLWGSIGLGYFIYGRKQQSWVATIGGLLMMIASYFTGSVLVMSLICLLLMVAVFYLLRQGY